MLKKIIFCFCAIWMTRPLPVPAQVTPAHVLFQYSMNPFQPTALPYNYLDKHDNDPRSSQDETSPRLKPHWYLNASSRSEIHPQTGTQTSSVLAVDYMDNPKHLAIKIGGGLAYHDLDAVQIASPYLHVSAGHTLGSDKYSADWYILGGAGIRLSAQRLGTNSILYKDINDRYAELTQS
jgi:hypothetical protein